jgi:putative spermidine/putrescine transport system permease protein
METFVPHRRRLWLYALAGLILLFLTLPVLIVVPMSFSGSRYLDFPPPQWSLRWFERFFSSPDWYDSMLVSLKLAVATVLVSTPVGVTAAYAIHAGEHPAFRRVQTILMLPLMVPHIIVAIGVFYAFVRVGWLGSFGSLVLAHVMLALPFVLITVLSGLRSFDMTQELVARSLGCSRFGAFMRVTLPQVKGSVLSGMLFAFVTSLDEVIVSLFIAVGQNATVTKVMFASLRDEIDPTIAAVSSLLIAGSLITAFLAILAGRNSARG